MENRTRILPLSKYVGTPLVGWFACHSCQRANLLCAPWGRPVYFTGGMALRADLLKGSMCQRRIDYRFGPDPTLLILHRLLGAFPAHRYSLFLQYNRVGSGPN